MAVEDFFIQVLDNFIISTKTQICSLFVLAIGDILLLSSFLTSQWAKTGTLSYGLWRQCDNGEDYRCCQSVDLFLGTTILETIPAWLGAARTFQCFGLVLSIVSTAATVLVVLVPGTRDSKVTTVISLVSTIATASSVIIGVAIFGGEYRKVSWLRDAYLGSSFGACVASGIMYSICALLLIRIGNTNVVGVKRDFSYPDCWASMDKEENLKTVTLIPNSDEFNTVINKFNVSMGQPSRLVIQIERVQNKSLYQQYCAEKEKLLKTHRSRMQIERELWHGTASSAINSINNNGFDRGYCGKNAVAYGQGVYFAVSAKYSANDMFSVPDYSGLKYMYLCNVLTGEYTLGSSGMRAAPKKPNSASHVIFDSVVDDLQRPTMFVIFSDQKAYPQYLITFLRAERY